jgi:hypothetical protein
MRTVKLAGTHILRNLAKSGFQVHLARTCMIPPLARSYEIHLQEKILWYRMGDSKKLILSLAHKRIFFNLFNGNSKKFWDRNTVVTCFTERHMRYRTLQSVTERYMCSRRYQALQSVTKST